MFLIIDENTAIALKHIVAITYNDTNKYMWFSLSNGDDTFSKKCTKEEYKFFIDHINHPSSYA